MIYIVVAETMGIQTMIFIVKNNPCPEKFMSCVFGTYQEYDEGNILSVLKRSK